MTGKASRPHLFRRAWRDGRGVSALEFALIAPVLILVYFGMAELSQAMMAQRRASHAASTVGDLISQYDSGANQVHDTDVTGVFNAANAIMAPFPTASLELRVTSIVNTPPTPGGTPQPLADWSEANGGASMPKYTKGATMSVPAGLLSGAGDSVVLAEAKYKYTSPVGQVLPNGLSFSETFYMKPRKTQTVSRCYGASNC
jgi:Flp pilus assembly protein TadG